MADDETPVLPEDAEDTETTDPDEPFDKERAMHTIRTLRNEARQYRREAKRVADLEAKLREFEDRDKSELERAQQRLSELEAGQRDRDSRLRETRLLLAVHQQAAQLGIADADLAVAALNRNQVEFDDDGDPVNLPDLLEELLERKPILKRSTEPNTRPAAPKLDSGSGSNTATGVQLTAQQLEAAAALGMSPERYALFLGGPNMKVSTADLPSIKQRLETSQ